MDMCIKLKNFGEQFKIWSKNLAILDIFGPPPPLFQGKLVIEDLYFKLQTARSLDCMNKSHKQNICGDEFGSKFS